MISNRPVLDERERSAQRPLRGIPPFDGDQQAAIRLQARRLAENPAFRTSKRCRLFLEHVIEQSLAESPEPLKERVLGNKVFGREPSYDTAADPVVRVTAGEIRRRLGQYYAEPAHQHELRVDLPAGSYTPTFTWPSVHEKDATFGEEGPQRTSGIAGAPAGARQLSGRVFGLALACLAVIALVGTMLASSAGRKDTAFDLFWAPLVQSKVPVLVCTGSNDLYELSERLRNAVDTASPAGDTAALTILPDEVQRVGARYVSVTDAVAIARLAALLHEHGTPYHVRENRATSFADLRASPTILVGMFSNAWTLELGSEFRYVPFPTPDGERIVIQDRQQPERADWYLQRPWPALNVTHDYALVSRVLDRVTGNMVVMGAGITPFGTTAALELLTSPQYLERALADAPRDWAEGNLQIVLKTRVIDGAAGPPRVLATHFW
ncbi:MAG: hypothetical protein GEU99_01580 [Luteitalea sp.]|nr:hypothetical protein [Luteitalea sp.]